MPNFEIVHILLVTSWEKLAYCNVLQISPSVMHWAMCQGGGHKILSRPLLFFFHRLTQGLCGFWQTPWAISCWKNIRNLQFSSPIFPITYFLPNHHTPWTTNVLSLPPCTEVFPQLHWNILFWIPRLTHVGLWGGFPGSSNQGEEERERIL